MSNDSLGDRMKTYEAVPKLYLTRRTPVIIRLDMCHGHTFTRGFKKPVDEIFQACMQYTMKMLCENIMGCVLGYTQSDEITLVLCDYKKLTTEAWFDNQVQKLVSVSASMASLYFNRRFEELISPIISHTEDDAEYLRYRNTMSLASRKGAYFDSRCFNVPKEEVCNCLIWRQQDATRNSIQGLAQALFPHKELQGMSCNELQDKMFREKDINWNDLPTPRKRGVCCVKLDDGRWAIDFDIPVFTQDREYIESRITFE